jgi:pyruvate formate lyase activating enzyme
LIGAWEQAKKVGIKYAYVGNVYDVQRQSTYCPECGQCLIERDWYELGKYLIKDGRCSKCSHEIAGVFDNKKGSWGRKRVPVIFEQGQAAPRFPGLL